jgi:hypothetical protein
LRGIAEHFQLNFAFVHSDQDGKITKYCDWVLLSKRPTLPGSGGSQGKSRGNPAPALLWTDDYSNLLQVLR